MWDRSGPRFEIGPKGELRREGQFTTWPPKWIKKIGEHSHMVRNLIGRRRPTKDEDIDRLIAIIEQARAEVRSRWPNATFRVLTWTRHDSPQGVRLRSSGMKLVWALDILPGRHDKDSAYRTSPGNRHPSALANRKLAEALSKAFGVPSHDKAIDQSSESSSHR